MIDPETLLRATFTRVAMAERVPPLPDFLVEFAAPVNELEELEELLQASATYESPYPRRTPRRRRALSGIAALAILGGGLSVAAAAGVPVLPASVMQALGWAPVPGAYNAYSSTARKLLTLSGPEGQPLQLWYADANDNGFCLSLTATVEKDQAAKRRFTVNPARQPTDGVGAGGCSGTVGSRYWREFGGDSFMSSNSQSTTFIIHVPGAATVHLQFDDGTSKSLPIRDAWTAGWLTAREANLHPVLVGLSADGSKIGAVPVR